MLTPNPRLFTVADAAQQAGVTGRTLRYYEELGLIQSARSPGGHRRYEASAVDELARIKNMQSLGFSLETIRKVLRYRAYVDERGERHLKLADLRSLAREARDDLERLQKRIRISARELADARRSAAQLERDCGFIESALRKREADGKT
jgi:DNA-binding transcriptional MerR regulator